MRSRKNEKQSPGNSSSARTNGDDLRRALDWIVSDKIFAGVTLHGNVKWTAAALVRVAVFWMWSAKSSLVEAADEGMGCVKRIYGETVVKSYQTLVNGLHRYSHQLLPILRSRLQGLMQQCDGTSFRVGLWLALAVDGSRVNVPRTLPNERRFCKPKKKSKRKKKSKKRRGRSATSKRAPTHKKKHYDPQPVGPQMWLTMIWHLGQRMPWSWKTGPSYSSERQHVLEMLRREKFPENTLFCGDAGFVGYDFWRAVAQDHHFLVRVGGNVRLLKKLGYVRERNGLVYCWPDAAMKKKQTPLILRLLHFKDARNNDVYLVTTVLDPKRLSDRQASEIYRRRWGIEVQFRSLKQTFERTKLRSRTPENATIELDWSLLSLWMVQLLALKEQTKAREPGVSTSIAVVLRIVRQMMQRDHDVPDRRESFQRQLGQALTDTYERRSKKKSRNYPRRKEEPATGCPIVKAATRDHKQQLKKIEAVAG
jgi:hypothetical protein